MLKGEHLVAWYEEGKTRYKRGFASRQAAANWTNRKFSWKTPTDIMVVDNPAAKNILKNGKEHKK